MAGGCAKKGAHTRTDGQTHGTDSTNNLYNGGPPPNNPKNQRYPLGKGGDRAELSPSPPRGNKGAWEPKNHEGAGRAPGLLLCYIGILGSDTEILYIMQKKALRAYSIFFLFFFSSLLLPPPPPTTNSAARGGGEGVLSALSSSSVVL